MKKILILSYFFPPCNLTASNRIGSWYKYLPDYGYSPIVVTRSWTGKELNEYQRLEFQKEKNILNKDSKIIHLPYIPILRDHLFIKGEQNILFKILSKFSTVINKLFNVLSYKNLYLKTREILKNDKEITLLIISANPFEQFFFGYLLKKEFSYLKWVADYRDDWNTTELITKRNFLEKIIFSIEKKREKRWLSNANTFISVSPYYVEKIGAFIKKNGHVVFNGYNEELLKLNSIENKEVFNITYNGSLYSTQNIEIFLESFKKLTDKYSKQIKISLFFPGLEYDKLQFARVKKLLLNYESFYKSSDRIPKNEVIDLQLKSDILLMVAHKNIKGIPSSKLFEYIGLRKQILLCPSDNDILKEIMLEYNKDYIAENSDKCFEILESQLLNKINNTKFETINLTVIEKYSIQNQIKSLSKILDQL